MAVTEEVGFEEIDVYILNRQEIVVQYIVTRPTMYLCKRMVRKPGAWVSWRWWDKEGINLEVGGGNGRWGGG